MGDPEDFTNFMGAVIDKPAYDNIKAYIDFAKASPEAEIVAGGGCDDRTGYFIEPTVVLTSNPKFKLMQEEIFGPVLTVFVYPDAELDKALELCDTGSPYGLTGAVFAADRQAILAIDRAAARRGRELLRQRQAHRGRRGPAAVRRGAGLGDERQGRVAVEPDPLDEPAGDQGAVRAAGALRLSVHGREVAGRRVWAPPVV